MNLPPFVFTLSFWKSLSFIVAGVLALLFQFGVIPANYALDAAAVLGIFLSILHFFQINPEMRARGLK